MDLSIIIPARNEMFLNKTIQDIFEHAEGDTEVIAILDGSKPVEPLLIYPKLRVIYHSESIGQRAATNEGAKISKAKYIMKLDAHCSFAQGFDIQLMKDIQPDWTIVPTMKNLEAFNWVCKNGHRRYQGKTGKYKEGTPEEKIGCPECGEPETRDIVWIAKKAPNSNSYCFDSEPHFQYFKEFEKRPEGQGQLTESMSLQGSCFMISRENYFKWNVCNEEFGSWGSQGIEVAFKTWMNGGKVIVDHNTYYAHMFRTQGGDFGFPYPLSGRQVQHAKDSARKLFYESWKGRVHTLSWLLEKFWPVPGWTKEKLEEVKQLEELSLKIDSITTVEEARKVATEVVHFVEKAEESKPTKGIIYYTDNRIDQNILSACQKNLLQMNLPITSCSLQPINFGKNITLSLERGYLTMFKQILTALENIDTDIVFFCEHDVLYHPSHFNFTPPDKNTFYYNMNSWVVRMSDNHAVYYDHRSLNGMCVYRETAITHYKERIALVEKEGFSRRIGFEPMTHHRIPWVNQFNMGDWKSEFPNLDLKHDKNLTPNRWSTTQFRDQRNCRNWRDIDHEFIPGWNLSLDEFDIELFM